MCKSAPAALAFRHVGYKSILHSLFLPPSFACDAADGFFVLLCLKSRPINAARTSYMDDPLRLLTQHRNFKR